MDKAINQNPDMKNIAEAEKYYIEMLETGNKFARFEAVYALGEIGSSRAVGALFTALKDSDPFVREAAEEFLQKIGGATPGSILDHLKHLNTPPHVIEFFKKKIAEMPLKLKWLAGAQGREKKWVAFLIVAEKIIFRQENNYAVIENFSTAILLAMGMGRDSMAVDVLINLLESPVPLKKLRRIAIRLLGRIGDPKAIKPLIKLFAERKFSLSLGAKAALINLAPEEAWRYVSEISDHNILRTMLPSLLFETVRPEFFTPLIDALKDKNRHIRRGAAQVLKRIGWTPGNDLEKALYSAARRSWLFQRLVQGGQLVETAAKKDRLPEYDKKPAVFPAAGVEWEKLIELGKDAVEPLFDILRRGDFSQRRKAVGLLSKTADPGIVDILIKKLKTQAGDSAPLVVEVLGNIGGKQAVESLILALKDDSLPVRRKAVEALIKTGDVESLTPFIDTPYDPGDLTQQGAAEVLDEMGWQPGNHRQLASCLLIRPGWEGYPAWKDLPGEDRDAVEILIEKLRDWGLEVQGKATIALGKIGDARVFDPLLQACYKQVFFIKWKKQAERTFKEICGRLEALDTGLVCKKCFLRYREKCRYLNIFYLPPTAYYTCPNCFSSGNYFSGILKIVLVLDHQFEEIYVENRGILLVNRFKLKKLCDFDEIRIKDADDYEVEKFVMELKNDPDDERRKKLGNIPVILSPRLKLSAAKMNLLRDNFPVRTVPPRGEG